MNMRNLAFIAVSALIVSGCSEPYPNWTVVDIRYGDLPRAVQKSFQRDFPDARITSVERSTFESRASGRPMKFRLFFNESRGSDRVIYDATGKRKDRFDFWFGRHEPNKTDAGNGSEAIGRVSNVLRSPSPDPSR